MGSALTYRPSENFRASVVYKNIFYVLKKWVGGETNKINIQKEKSPKFNQCVVLLTSNLKRL